MSLMIQLAAMRELWPEFQTGVVSGLLRSRGTVQPTSHCEIYRVRLEKTVTGSPKAYVEHPRLVRRAVEPETAIPHIHEGPRPCLFVPEDWRPNHLVAKTVVGWLACWLYFYETWHATGVWLGGGHEVSSLST